MTDRLFINLTDDTHARGKMLPHVSHVRICLEELQSSCSERGFNGLPSDLLNTMKKRIESNEYATLDKLSCRIHNEIHKSFPVELL